MQSAIVKNKKTPDVSIPSPFSHPRKRLGLPRWRADARRQAKKDRPARRLETLDLVRGITLASMFLYHGAWDLLYLPQAGAGLAGIAPGAYAAFRAWYEGLGGHLWQQSICRTFIFLSGFCVPFSRRLLRRGLEVSAGGLAVTLVTCLFLYEDRVVFGVLTFLGAAMLLAWAARKLASRAGNPSPGGQGSQRPGEAPPLFTQTGDAAVRGQKRARQEACREKKKGMTFRHAASLLACALLFYITRWINRGYLRIWPGLRIPLPSPILATSITGGDSLLPKIPGLALTALGFPAPGFFSTDYFSLLPWIFLFGMGISLHLLILDAWPRLYDRRALHLQAPLLNWLGRHSLIAYLLHQPAIYLLLHLFFRIFS